MSWFIPILSKTSRIKLMTCNCDLCNKYIAANSQNTVPHLKYAYKILLHISIVHVMVTQQG